MYYLALLAPVLALVLVGTMNFAYAHGCQGHGLFCHTMPNGTYWSEVDVINVSASMGMIMVLAITVLKYRTQLKSVTLSSRAS
jgi:hypothetical protein